jgi:hypothetical protein
VYFLENHKSAASDMPVGAALLWLTISGLKGNTSPPEDSKRRRYVNDLRSGMCEM